MIHLETDRLILRDYVEDDLSEYCRLKMDSQTMYYLQDIQLHSFECISRKYKGKKVL